MADKKIKGNQLNTLPKAPEELEQISFNLDKQDQFICSQGVTFIHYKAMPSPIGLKDKGEYRRSDSLDTISENGFVYKKCGSFTGVLLNNSKQKTPTEGGLYDHSTARLTLPRYYDKDSEEFADERIHLVNGDRIYLYKLDKDDRDVVNYQLVEYEPNKDNFLQFPATSVETIMDSKGFEYKEKVHFKITKDGNIRWYKSKKNPGIDPETGRGRVYSIRYRYEAHWYVTAVLNEMRIGRTTENGIRKETRMPYQVQIQREYVYHNRNRGDSKESNKETETERTVSEPTESIDENKYEVKVNVNSFE